MSKFVICSSCQNNNCSECLDIWNYGDDEVSCICDCSKDVVDIEDDFSLYGDPHYAYESYWYNED